MSGLAASVIFAGELVFTQRFALLSLDFPLLGYLPYWDFRLWLGWRSVPLHQQPATGA